MLRAIANGWISWRWPGLSVSGKRNQAQTSTPRAQHRHHPENPAPARHQQHRLAQRRRDHRHDHEHHRDRRLQPRHAIALITVADDRRRQHRQPRRGQPQQRPRDQQRIETGDQRGGQRQYDIARDAAHHHRPPPKAIRQRAGDQRADPGKDQEQPHHQLPLIGAGRTEIMRNPRQRGQHRIDRQRLERLQHRHQADEFARANFPGARVGGGFGGGLGSERFHGRAHGRWRRGRPEDRLRGGEGKRRFPGASGSRPCPVVAARRLGMAQSRCAGGLFGHSVYLTTNAKSRQLQPYATEKIDCGHYQNGLGLRPLSGGEADFDPTGRSPRHSV